MILHKSGKRPNRPEKYIEAPCGAVPKLQHVTISGNFNHAIFSKNAAGTYLGIKTAA